LVLAVTLVLAMLAAPTVAQAAPNGDALAQKIAAAKAALHGGKSMALIGSGPYWIVSLAGDDLFCLEAEALGDGIDHQHGLVDDGVVGRDRAGGQCRGERAGLLVGQPDRGPLRASGHCRSSRSPTPTTATTPRPRPSGFVHENGQRFDSVSGGVRPCPPGEMFMSFNSAGLRPSSAVEHELKQTA
jgi:hypothetical protein